MVRHAPCGDQERVAIGESLHRRDAALTLVVRESCYPFLQTLLHGAFQWLQPRSPVVVVVVERGRGPDPLAARAEAARAVGSGRAEAARAALANLPAGESRRAGKAEENLLRVAKVGDANLQGSRVAGLRDAKEADARAEAAVAVPVAERNLPWLV